MCDKRLASPYLGKTILLQNEIVAKQYFGKMIFWQNDTLAKQYFGKMTSWDTHRLLSKPTHCSKQTILQIGSRKKRKLDARKTTNPKVFDLHRKNSSKNIMKQTDHREPELSATKSDFHLRIWLRRIVRCAAAPRVVQDWVAFYHHGCRDAGTPLCMNMLWSHALPIRVFRVKTVQPSLNLSIFGHENHVSWSFYRFMLRDKRHCLQIEAWGWQHQLQTSQHHPSIRIAAQTHSTNAIWPQKHQLNW